MEGGVLLEHLLKCGFPCGVSGSPESLLSIAVDGEHMIYRYSVVF
jgi:hypothetical protein